MEVKIVRGMPAAEYHAVRAASSTRLKEILRSPAHLKWMDENGKTADSLALGEAFHMATLEPEKFFEQFIVMPKYDRRTKDGRAAFDMFRDANADKKVIDQDDYNSVCSMRDAIMDHPAAHDLLSMRSETELSLFWTNMLGQPSKARIDAYSDLSRCVVDLKSTVSADPGEFARSAFKYGYHLQAAWYLDAARMAGLKTDSIVFVAVEKTPPFGVACYRFDEDSIDAGRVSYMRAIAILHACESSREWPGYSPMIETIRFPKWRTPEREEVL
jgi:hypothetical protein